MKEMGWSTGQIDKEIKEKGRWRRDPGNTPNHPGNATSANQQWNNSNQQDKNDGQQGSKRMRTQLNYLLGYARGELGYFDPS